MKNTIEVARDRLGNVLPSAQVTVYNYPSGSLATIYAANPTVLPGTGPVANPITADKNGNYQFYAANGRYSIQINYQNGNTTANILDITVYDPADPFPVNLSTTSFGFSLNSLQVPSSLFGKGTFVSGQTYNNSSASGGTSDYVFSLLNGKAYQLIGPTGFYNTDPSTDNINWQLVQGATLGALASAAAGMGADLIGNASRSYVNAASLQSAPNPSVANGETLTVSIQGLNAYGVGQGLFDWQPASTATPVVGMVIAPGGNTGVAGRWVRPWVGEVWLEWFGGDPTGATFSDAAFAAARAYVFSVKGVRPKLRIGCGLFKFQSQLNAGSFQYTDGTNQYTAGGMQIEGSGYDVVLGSAVTWAGTLLDFSSSTGLVSAIKAVCTPSGITNHGISNLAMRMGNFTTYPIELSGATKFKTDRIAFLDGYYAHWYHNTAAALYTEQNEPTNCTYNGIGLCRYTCDAGSQGSFHGTGIGVGCLAALQNSAGQPPVLIDAPVGGVTPRPYNSPMYIRTIGPTPSAVIQNNTGSFVWFHGTLTTEYGSATAVPLGGGSPIYYGGTVSCNNVFVYGSMVPVGYFGTDVGGDALFSRLFPLTTEIDAYTYGSPVTMPLLVADTTVIRIHVRSSKTDYFASLYVYNGNYSGGSPSFVIVGAFVSVGTAPTFSINASSQLTITSTQTGDSTAIIYMAREDFARNIAGGYHAQQQYNN